MRLGFSGKLIPKKDPLMLVKAISCSKFKDQIELMIIGDGPLKEDMLEALDQYKLNYEFLGFLNQTQLVREGYSQIDVLVLPSNENETWGLVVNEVMTGGIPAIVSDTVGCHSDLITEGETGYVFKSGNMNDLTDKIDLFVNRHLSGTWDDSNVLRKIEHYSLENTTQGYINCLQSVIVK